MIRYIVLRSQPYEGLETFFNGGEDDDPLPTFATREIATAYAKFKGLISPKGRRNEAEILAVKVSNDR